MRNQNAAEQQKTKASVGKTYAAVKKLRLPVLMLAAIFLTVFLIGNGAGNRGTGSEINNSRMTEVSGGNTLLLNEEKDPSRPTEVPTLEPGETLTVGDVDGRIPDIQIKLASLGYIEADEPGETFNAPLENAVKLFQRANNMNQTGEVDSLFMNILYSNSPAEYVIEFGNSGDDVMLLQERLSSLGYYDEKINGYYGTSTKNAIEGFQTLNGLEVNGVVDTGTYETLFSYEAVAGHEPQPMDGLPQVSGEPEPIRTADASSSSDPTGEPEITREPTAPPAPTDEPFVDFVTEGHTNSTYVNFRSSPSTSSSIIMVLSYGTQVRIIAKTSEWYRVSYAGYFGYIAAPYVTIGSAASPSPAVTSAPTQAPTAAPTHTPAPTQEPFVDFVSDGYINRPYVNFRSAPSTDSQVLSVLSYGTQVRVIAKTSEWYRVVYAGSTGYVASPYITLGSSSTPTQAPTSAPTQAPTAAPTQAPTSAPTQAPTAIPGPTADPFTELIADGYINRASVNFRTGPSTNDSVITSLPYGTVVNILATNNEWYRARYNGTVGYICCPYVTIGTPPTSAPTSAPAPTPTPQPTAPTTDSDVEDFVEVLMAQLGKPYIGGHSGPNSFDCSGYVYYCLKLCGVNIGRLTAAGYASYNGWTKVTGYGNLRRGDLMFFYNDARTRISHAAVFLGNGQLIHASFSAGKVVISNANSNWYQSHFAWGRRVFDN